MAFWEQCADGQWRTCEPTTEQCGHVEFRAINCGLFATISSVRPFVSLPRTIEFFTSLRLGIQHGSRERFFLQQLISQSREFPSLSNNQPQPSQSTWAGTGGIRNIGPSGNMRIQQQQQPPPLSSQQQAQQEDLFNSSSQLPSSGMGFRFGQNAVGQSAQPTSAAEEFPPLNNRSASGEIGQDRAALLMHNNNNVGFGQQNGLGFGSANPPQANRSNGLLNALSGSGRTPSGNRVASPTSISGKWR